MAIPAALQVSHIEYSVHYIGVLPSGSFSDTGQLVKSRFPAEPGTSQELELVMRET